MVLDQLRLAIVLWRLKADLCHSLHTALPVLAPCPVVGTVLDLMFELFPEYAQAVRSRPYRLFRWAARHQARRLVCISATTADDVKRLWRVPSSRIDVIQLGTNFLGHSTAVAVAEVLAHDRVVLSPYNLEPRKNLAGLLRAFARCRPACAQLVLYGRAAVTPQREAEFDALVAELGLAPKVIRVGYVTDAELRWLYRRASVFVFPSLYEGFGYPVLEAMAAGARVVARTASAPAEVVGPAGVLVETADPEQLASAIDRLLADSERASVLGRLAAARAEEYTVSRMAEQTWRVYQKALGRCDQT
ncbi:N-acetylgalactosamine-N,N'-diacetylbacillosaminyl-diphospho-undecaprenol 4-alpha-N-acetylgalactosaminyltransferase [Gemmata obscuriglobus]|nr:N-acetylgalactosamine-N,N'-diacetylbacillosaminyl-diphospho-undecaprenol 4-alpha-N-acetylgalactosaminyltransferase [Gemmata obscuriglobus]VTS04109.1 group 1 glycosyl transferase : Glycosyl transferase group 1 OS=Cyanothece sp. (strain PCC 7425 / ATCC 29141) GN=Cyan7425_1096 PE=4 SV=1: Glycos_transf_1 [Gemmata obscuriglobus UQM 2246]